MGRLRKGYNWKARRQNEPSTQDDSEIKKIKLDHSFQAGKYDSSNALVLPSSSKKQKVERKDNEQPQKKRLTKKQRKKLEHVLESREKKKNRAELLEKLQEVQATQKELESMVSISSMQTKGLKRHFIQKVSKKPTGIAKISKVVRRDPNVLGLESSSESESDNDSSEWDDSSEHKEENQDQEAAVETAQVAEIKKNVPDSVVPLIKAPKANAEPQIKLTTASSTTKVSRKYVEIVRDPEIQAGRLKLPILAEEQVVMEAINENPVVIICGETGSGKTTQVPQFLYEAGYASEGLIGVTEPRRIAAISMSKRVGQEMTLGTNEVSYLIRFSGNVTDNTKIKFMTDGVLMKEIQNDFLLSRYSVIIIDEAHERSVYSDILIGLLSRIVPLRHKKGKPLKLLIMSATLRVEDFTENTRLFKTPPPLLKVDSRQFPVTIHFNKHTLEDYVSEAFRKVCKIHQKLPEGGILVFVTGQQEVMTLCRKLRRKFPKKQLVPDHLQNANKENNSSDMNADDHWDDVKAFKTELKALHKKQKVKDDVLPKINLDDYSVEPMDEDQLQETDHIDDHSKEDDELPEASSDDENDIMSETAERCAEPLFVLPLFSLLAPEKQALVFSDPPKGTRLCVVATNVAETSLTIPNIRYVVDTGKTKTRLYDKVTGISAFDVVWTSKASANQRAGRAGRTGPGHCYRLYSSAVFSDEFPKFSVPEIIRRPVDDLLLQMKAMGIDKVINFPFPTPPDQEALKAAEKRLIVLGALEKKGSAKFWKEEGNSSVTALGRAMASFPVSPRYAKMLALSHQHDLLPYMIAIISALTVQEVLMEPTQEENATREITVQEKHKKWKQIKSVWAGQGSSLALGDVMVLLKAVGASEFASCTREFCERHGLRHKAMVEIRKLRQQITNEVNLAIPQLNLCLDPGMSPPTDLQCRLLRQLVLTGMVDHVARRVDYEKLADEEKLKAKHAYQCLDVAGYIFIHPKSVLHKELPEYVMYQEIFETKKMYMRVVSAVDVTWLPVYAPQLCTFSQPLSEPPPRYDPDGDRMLCHCTSTFGTWAWPICPVEVEFPAGLDSFRWFACCLLEGDVCPKLKHYADLLLAPAKVMVKSWAKLQKRTEGLLQALVSKQALSKSQLETAWQEDRLYLLNEYRQWLPESVHYEVGQLWPPT